MSATQTTPTGPGCNGRLKVFLGYSPGVGKTRCLIREAHALKERGMDVVIGFTRGRGDKETTSLLNLLESVPLRQVEFRGVAAGEMDLEALVRRRPQAVVVDDVAHTNLPGSLNKRRYLDILGLLDKGISVLCAFDVHQLESLSSLVGKKMGVPVRETVPDSFLARADEVVAVDVAVDDLLDRLNRGDVVPPEQLEEARTGFFRRDRLNALRELALREVADVLERENRSATNGKRLVDLASSSSQGVLVCLASASPRALILIRKGARLAGRLNARWYVLSVETPSDSSVADLNDRLKETLEIARDSGAEVMRRQASDPVAAILEVARANNVGDILVGRSHQPWWKRFLGYSPVTRLIQEAEGFDVHVISHDEDGPG